MNMQALKDAFIRAVRTFFQAAIPVFILGAKDATDLTSLVNTTLLQTAALAGIIAALSFVMNLLESATGEPLPKG